MASLITKFDVTKDAWVLVASGKNALAVQRSGSQPVEIVVLTAGSPAPAAVDGTVDAYVLYDGFTSLAWESDEAADVYARSRELPSQVRVVAGAKSAVAASGRGKVEPLGTWVTAQTAVVGATTAFVTLAAGTRRVSITARTADLYFKIGTGAVTATVGNGNGFLSAGATKDFAVPASAKIAFIRAGSTDATIEIDELGEPN